MASSPSDISHAQLIAETRSRMRDIDGESITAAVFSEIISKRIGRRKPFSLALISKWEHGRATPSSAVLDAVRSLNAELASGSVATLHLAEPDKRGLLAHASKERFSMLSQVAALGDEALTGRAERLSAQVVRLLLDESGDPSPSVREVQAVFASFEQAVRDGAAPRDLGVPADSPRSSLVRTLAEMGAAIR